jgi:hypothetical protein
VFLKEDRGAYGPKASGNISYRQLQLQSIDTSNLHSGHSEIMPCSILARLQYYINSLWTLASPSSSQLFRHPHIFHIHYTQSTSTISFNGQIFAAMRDGLRLRRETPSAATTKVSWEKHKGWILLFGIYVHGLLTYDRIKISERIQTTNPSPGNPTTVLCQKLVNTFCIPTLNTSNVAFTTRTNPLASSGLFLPVAMKWY